MAYACNCPPGHHDGPVYRLCVGNDGTKTVYCPPITPGVTTVSCEAVPMPIVPDPRDARIAELEAENARLEALIVFTVEAATGIDADLHAEYDRIKAKP